MPTILVVEDDDASRMLTQARLKPYYGVRVARDGEEALEVMERHPVDLAVVDAMMPRMDGFELVRHLRATNQDLPVLMLTALDTMASMRDGFDSGIDDYLTKPANAEELLLRVRALLRRAHIAQSRRVSLGGVELDADAHTTSYEGCTLDLPRKEFGLLFLLMSYPGQVFTNDQLLDRVWGVHDERDLVTLKTHVSRLRSHLARLGCPLRVANLRGLGYRVEIAEGEDAGRGRANKPAGGRGLMLKLPDPKADGPLGQIVAILLDVTSRTEATLAVSTCWGLGYGLVLLRTGMSNQSLHFVAMGRYYLVMAAVALCLALGFRRARKVGPRDARRAQMWATLLAGLLLLVANATIAVLVKGLVRGIDGRGSGLVQFIVQALYSMVLVGMTVRGFALYGRGPSLLLATTKAVSVCKALMSLVFLTVTAAFTFGSTGKPVWGLVEIGAKSLGNQVAVLSMAVAVWSIVRAVRGLADHGAAGRR